jgi:hypothetical protein
MEEMKIGTIREDNIGTSNTSEPIVPRSYCRYKAFYYYPSITLIRNIQIQSSNHASPCSLQEYNFSISPSSSRGSCSILIKTYFTLKIHPSPEI